MLVVKLIDLTCFVTVVNEKKKGTKNVFLAETDKLKGESDDKIFDDIVN